MMLWYENTLDENKRPTDSSHASPNYYIRYLKVILVCMFYVFGFVLSKRLYGTTEHYIHLYSPHQYNSTVLGVELENPVVWLFVVNGNATRS